MLVVNTISNSISSLAWVSLLLVCVCVWGVFFFWGRDAMQDVCVCVGVSAMDKAKSDSHHNSLLKIWLYANLHKIQLSN